jgi:hypothetical protein
MPRVWAGSAACQLAAAWRIESAGCGVAVTPWTGPTALRAARQPRVERNATLDVLPH